MHASTNRLFASVLAGLVILVPSAFAMAVVIDFQNLPVPPSGAFNGDPGTLVPGQSVTAPWTSGGVAFSNTFGIDSYGGFDYEYWSGFAYSDVVDTTDAAFTNEYASYPGGGFGSSTYAVAYFRDVVNSPVVTLPVATTVAGFRIANTTYAALTMKNGDLYGFSAPLPTGGWFATTATGRLGGTTTGAATFYLADLRGATPPGVLSSWSWFDLTSLGTVDRIEFSFDGSDKGLFGLNTPAYFAMDDLTVNAAPPVVTTIDVASGTQTQSQAGYPTLTGATPVVKTGVGTLVLDQTNTLTGSTTVQQGTLQLANGSALGSSTLAVAAGATASVANYLTTSVGGLDLSANGLVDLTNGSLSVASGLTVPQLVAELLEGRGDGSWTGTSGITSSTAAADVASSIPRSVGWLDNGDGSLTVAYAAPGDTNLDWSIDILDAANFLALGKFDTGAPATWLEGDFSYDGIVDILDAADFFSTGLFDAGTSNTAPGSAGAVAAVPEPAGMGVVAAGLAVATLACGARRLRGRQRHA